MEKIHGAIQRIVYFDEEQGFGIVKIKLDYKDKTIAEYRNTLFSNILTVLSSFDRKPLIDEEFEFIGEFETSSYGVQLRASSFRRKMDQSLEGVIAYLSSDYFPGIGKQTAKKIYDALGPQCLQQIIADKKVLNQIKLTSKQKKIIYENLVKNEANERQMVQLLSLGLTMRMAVRIVKVLGNRAFEAVRDNPYQLIDLVEGIGFIRADNIAFDIGIPKDSPLRLKALILYTLHNEVYAQGHTYFLMQSLFIEVKKRMQNDDHLINQDVFLSLLKELVVEKKIIIDEQKYIYATQIYYDEIHIAKYIYQILQQEIQPFTEEEIDIKINQIMKNNHIIYAQKQKEAIMKAIIEPIVIVTGGPGTGKSTMIKGIIDTFVAMHQEESTLREAIALVAPTGRAAKRLREVTKHPAITIHKLLGYEGGDRFTAVDSAPLPIKMIIVDEVSMVDVRLLAILLSVLDEKTKIVFVGDSDQLPSVGPGNVLQDLINSKEITTIKLNEIHRQASDSTIITLAHSIKDGQMAEDILQVKHDRSFIRCEDQQMITSVEKTIQSAIDKGMDLIKDIQVLIPLYKGEVGINAMNHHLQNRFNPQEEELIFQGQRFRINDKVIQLVNRSEKQVMNGDIGYILSFEKENERMIGLHVMFDFGSVYYEREELEDLYLAYAISIHKAQGSEFPLVIVPFSFKYYIMLHRKLIYTAITRAKEYLVLIGNIDSMRKGIVEIGEGRKTRLKDRIKEMFASPNQMQKELHNEENEIEDISPYDFM